VLIADKKMSDQVKKFMIENDLPAHVEVYISKTFPSGMHDEVICGSGHENCFFVGQMAALLLFLLLLCVLWTSL